MSQFLKTEACMYAVDPSKVHVVYDEADTKHFAPGCLSKEEARVLLGIPNDRYVVLMIARVAPNKRHDLLLGQLHT